jgi:hypothetical protein
MNQKGFTPIAILLIVAGILAVGGIWYYEMHQSILAQTEDNGSSSASALNPEPSSGELAATTAAPISVGLASSTTSAVSPTPTSTWLTYNDLKDGFSFQFPSDYKIDNGSYENILLLPSLGIRIYHKRSDQSILDFWSSATDFMVLTSTPMTVNGYPALYIVGEEPSGGGGDQVGTSDLLVVDNNTLIVDFFPSPFDALSNDNNPIPEAILNSLRF